VLLVTGHQGAESSHNIYVVVVVVVVSMLSSRIAQQIYFTIFYCSSTIIFLKYRVADSDIPGTNGLSENPLITLSINGLISMKITSLSSVVQL